MARKNTKIETVIAWLLYLFIFLLPWQTQWIFSDSQIQWQKMSLFSFDIVLLVLLILSLKNNKSWTANNLRFKVSDLKLNLKKSLLVASYLLLVALSFLNVIWSNYYQLSLYWSARLILALGLFWLLKNIKLDFRKLAWVLVLTISIQAFIGFGQFITQDNLMASKWLGNSAQQASTLGTSVIETSQGRWLRAYGTQGSPNILGGLLVVGIILVFYLFTNNRNLQNSNYKTSNFLLVTSYWLLVTNLLLISTLFFTFSRSAWLGLLLIFFFWLIKQSKKSLAYNSKFIIPAVLLVTILAAIYSPLVQTRFSSTSRLEQKSTEQRINQLQEFQEIIKINPLLGVGLGNYTVSLQERNPQLAWYNIQPVHNVYLLILTELGVVGLILFFLILKSTVKNIKSIKDINTRLAFTALLAAFLILGLFDHYWWTYASGFYLFWLTIALIHSNQLPSQTR